MDIDGTRNIPIGENPGLGETNKLGSLQNILNPIMSPAHASPLMAMLPPSERGEDGAESVRSETSDDIASEFGGSNRDNDWVYEDGNFQEYLDELSNMPETSRAFSKMKDAANEVNDQAAAMRAQRMEYLSERLWYKKQANADTADEEDMLKEFGQEKFMRKDLSQQDLMCADFAETIEKEEASKTRTLATLPKHLRRHKVCAVFGHSLERNGANNFLLYLVRHLDRFQEYFFDIYTPKEGPMRGDYESMGMRVTIHDKESDEYEEELRKALRHSQFAIINTIMGPEVVNACAALQVPNIWVIHEAWPRDQIGYYAKEVFLMKNVDVDVITDAFASADQIIFPARVQLRCYEGLFSPEKAKVVYNGIPLTAINVFSASADRNAVRSSLGYNTDDLVILHLGTVCRRKAQHLSVEAFVKFCKEFPQLARNAKLLMVGARYIREHEIKYIDNLKSVLSKNGLTDRVMILDTKKNVLPFYKAADIVVVPSLNEVLPLVICEAMAFERPVIASNIDGIPEALDSGREGILIPPGDTDAFKEALKRLCDVSLRCQMGRRGRLRVNEQFGFAKWAEEYRRCMTQVLARYEEGGDQEATLPSLRQPIVLVDLDNTLVDFDDSFQERWREVNPVHAQANPMLVFNRQHYQMEDNFAPPLRPAVRKVISETGFFADLKPFPGAIEALHEMVALGYNILLCTSPQKTCFASSVSEKYEWVEKNLGSEWMSLLVVTHDKTAVRGDLLIDDSPDVVGTVPDPEWEHIVFDAPYNRAVKDTSEEGFSRRLYSWSCWKQVVMPLLENQRRAAAIIEKAKKSLNN